MTILELQFEYLAVKKDLWFALDMTLIFLDIALQHLQPWIPQPAEWSSRLGVTGMVIGSTDCIRSSTFLSLALTSFLLSVLLFLRLRQGAGMYSTSSWVGFMVFFIFLTFRSGVYSVTRNVSYLQGSFSLDLTISGLAL